MTMTPTYATIASWANLYAAWQKAARGKRGGRAAAGFEHRLADNLLALQRELTTGNYGPGEYVHFFIHEPKRRKISAAEFRDRVVHHALCNVIEPRFEGIFIPESFANRRGRGTHKAIDLLQAHARRFRFVLRMDIVKHFPSIDHEILIQTLAREIPEQDVMSLVKRIVQSGAHVLEDEYEMTWFEGDDLLAACRPRGLPIGNLTSQFWSNCYLHPLDQFITRGLECKAYVRYVDDFALFSDSKKELWAWKRRILGRLADLRLTVHEHSAQVAQTQNGIPWLGFVIYPSHRKIKARKVRQATQRLRARFDAYNRGEIDLQAVDASIRAWINHASFADTWGLRRHMLSKLVLRPPNTD